MEEKPQKRSRKIVDRPLKKRGPKSPYNESLGNVIMPGLKIPPKVAELFKEWPFKRLLNWMAMDESFKAKILGQVPKDDPPEP